PDPVGLAVGDFNHDGFVDLAIANEYPANKVLVLLNNSLGVFTQSGPYAVGSDPLRLVAADVNGDGNLDLVTVNQFSTTVSVVPGNHDGSFQTARNFDVGLSPKAVTVGDFNRDGKPDLAVANNGGVTLLQGNGSGNFTPDPGSPVSAAAGGGAVA